MVGNKHQIINYKKHQDKDVIFLLENNKKCGISSVMGARYVVSGDNKKILHIDADKLYG